MRRLLTGCIKLYQYCISPLMASHCRFHPSCSSYALEAIEKHGALSGSWLTIKRLLRCHPYNPGGYDPVPDHCCRSQQHNHNA